MKCHCGKALVEKTIATKTRKAGKHTIVDSSRQALICAEHGVVAWDPVRPYNIPVGPPMPWPYAPVIPFRPLNPFGAQPQPNTIRPGITWINTTGPGLSGGSYRPLNTANGNYQA